MLGSIAELFSGCFVIVIVSFAIELLFADLPAVKKNKQTGPKPLGNMQRDVVIAIIIIVLLTVCAFSDYVANHGSTQLQQFVYAVGK